MARYRRNKSGGVPEAVFGLIIIITAMTMVNPFFREIFVSTAQVILFLGTIAALIYFINKWLKIPTKPAIQPADNITPRKGGEYYTPPYSTVRETPLNVYNTDAPPPTGRVNKNNFISPSPEDYWDEYFNDRTRRVNSNNLGNSIPEPYFREANLPSLKPLEWNESILHMIEWKRFEMVSEEYFRMSGYDPRETEIGADGGVDIRIYKTGSATQTPVAIVQCKAWNAYRVGVKPIRELFGVMALEQVPTGIFMTSGDFTSEAQDFAAKEFPDGKKMVLISGSRFIHKIKKLSEENQIKLLDIALEGDYKTPTCPQCDVKMTMREGKKGKNPGSQFWGCIHYPKCRQTLAYKE